MSDDDDKRPNVSNPPPAMSERTLRNTLEAIELQCDANGEAIGSLQTIEDERAGASKLRARLLTAFGGLLTAAVVAAFVWVWNAQTSNALQDAAIVELGNDAHEHDPPPAGHTELAAANRTTDRRVDAVDRATKANGARLDRLELEATTRQTAILEELRRLRASRRRPATWGGGE